MMKTLRAYVYAFFAALLAFGGIMLYRMGGKNAEIERTEDNLEAAQKAKDTRYELENSDDQRLVDILSGKLRDDR